MKLKSSWLMRMLLVSTLLLAHSSTASGQTAKRSTQKKTNSQTAIQVTQLAKLRDEYIAATKEYKGSLERLLTNYENNVKRVEEKLTISRKLYDEGLISKRELEEFERAVTAAKDKIAETQKQMIAADSQIANVLLETRADEELTKRAKLAKNALFRTTAFIRFNGGTQWTLGDAWKVQAFFSDAFKRSLPVAVFGQGAIHDRWRLDHRNAMDISVHPDSAEGQALLGFLQKNGIAFSAFREAIPGTATGPHIHIGRPSHRY